MRETEARSGLCPYPAAAQGCNVGDGQTSCVIALYGQPTTTRDSLAPGPRRLLEMLASHDGGEVTTGTWQKAAGHAESTHFSHQTTLKSRGYISQGPTGTGFWVITDKGRAVVSPTPTPNRLQIDSNHLSPMTPTPTPSTPLGVEEEGRVTNDYNDRSNELIVQSLRRSPLNQGQDWWG